jgi:hypothetical protein
MDNSEELFFESLAGTELGEHAAPAPARLKAKIYSVLTHRQAESGPLASLSSTKASDRGLCVFEQLVEISPLPERAKCLNYCSVCHARILAEKIENAPIYWSHCPYVRFQNR